MTKAEIKSIVFGNLKYPELLKEIPSAPKRIFALGNFFNESDVNGKKIAIVGTRKATFQGKQIAREIAANLTHKGFIIVSGLAMGIDTAAHEGCLSAGGKTIAVLACGLDQIYPRQNENLSKKILESNGAIISEYPTGTPALQHQFLERNRIVSGLSIATIVIEAPAESGALVTARLAAEQGREVFVFPGAINNFNYRGSHRLIRDGGRLVSSIDDIIEDLGLENDLKQQELCFKKIQDKNQMLIIEVIKNSGAALNIDKIIELTKLETQVVNQNLTMLVIQGFIKETSGKYLINF